MELAVDVAAYCTWAAYGLHVALLNEKLLDVVAKLLEIPLGEVSAVFHLGYPAVKVHSHFERGAVMMMGAGGEAGEGRKGCGR